ncbi:MAG: class II aldolase/adducin family protein [Ectothiorhodospiraceae bacterium]|nr:class II aldolase/adducin family protein [Ectothiorhodospiraceae bacterium]
MSATAADVAAAERAVRVDLAACYRLVDLNRLGDLTATHISARVPGEDAFLLNPHGLLFDEITASSLVKVGFDGEVRGAGPRAFNPAGFNIHSAVLAARPDVACVIHTHTRAGMAVAAMRCGLLPISQHAMRFHRRIGVHEYEGMVLDRDERARLAADLGPHHAMLLRNHGLLVAGRSVAEAFRLMHMLERACQVQVDAMAAGADLALPSESVCETTARQYESFGTMGGRDWRAQLRRLDRLDPSYRD